MGARPRYARRAERPLIFCQPAALRCESRVIAVAPRAQIVGAFSSAFSALKGKPADSVDRSRQADSADSEAPGAPPPGPDKAGAAQPKAAAPELPPLGLEEARAILDDPGASYAAVDRACRSLRAMQAITTVPPRAPPPQPLCPLPTTEQSAPAGEWLYTHHRAR